MRHLFRRILLILAFTLVLLILGAATASANTTHGFDNGSWYGDVTHLDWSQMELEPDFSLDFEHPVWTAPWPFDFIAVPSLKFSLEMTIGLSGNFDITIEQPNLKDSANIDTAIRNGAQGIWTPGRGMYRERVDEGNIFDYIPVPYFLGLDMGCYIMAASTQPVRLRGTFTNYYSAKLSTEKGLTSTVDEQFQFTHIQPLEPQKGQHIVAYVGSQFESVGTFISLDTSFLKIGPILSLKAETMGGGIADVTVRKDEMEFAQYPEWNVNQIHSCTENGMPGCLEGQYRVVYAGNGEFGINASAEIPLLDVNIELYRDSWPIDDSYNRRGAEHIVGSLTWNDEIKRGEHCDHIYYKVPVATWSDADKTIPISGICVTRDGAGNVDPNMVQYSSAITGRNPNIPDDADRAGKAGLYLPYINGRHTIKVDSEHNEGDKRAMGGQAQQPADMQRGENPQVDIVLESAEKTTYTVRKVWDIDLESKDKPESIDVLLQVKRDKMTALSWSGYRKATLNAANNWTYTFEDVPAKALNEDGEIVDLTYRIRELKAKAPGGGGGGEGGGGGGEGGGGNPLDDEDAEDAVVQNEDGLYIPDRGALAEESKRVVPARFDLDNVRIWEAVKGNMTDIGKVWEFEPTLDYVMLIAKGGVFPKPQVSYKVEEYETNYGKHVDAHTTRYEVEYSEDGHTTTITNTAILSFNIYKRWIMLGEEKVPDFALLTLLYRPEEEFREHTGMDEKTALWIPVIRPLGGNMFNVVQVLGEALGDGLGDVVQWLSKLDADNKLSIPLAIGKAKGGKGFHNPLTKWRVTFKVKKYGYLLMPGVPVEFMGAELSSVILKDILKYYTGLDIPVSISFDLFNEALYVSAWGKPLQYPLLDQEWEYASNVINTWWKGHGDNTVSISGTKLWVNDKPADRPEYINIKVMDGETLKATVKVSQDKNIISLPDQTETIEYKVENADENSWIWSLTNKDCPSLEADKTYTIREEMPEGYANPYTCSIDGYDLTNAKGLKNRVVVRVGYDPADATRPTNINIKIKDGSGAAVGKSDGYALSGDSLTLTDGDPDVSLDGKDFNAFTIEESFTQPTDGTKWITPPSVSGPEKKIDDQYVTYTYTVTNRANPKVQVVVTKDWQDDSEASRPDSVTVSLKQDGTEVETLTLSKDNSWTATSTKDLYRIDETTGKTCVYTVEEKDLPAGYTVSVSEETETEGGIRETITFTLTNSADVVTVKGRKTWDDDDDAAGKRPEALLIRVMTPDGPAEDYQGNYVEQTVRKEDWSWNFDDLPRTDAEGNEIRYHVLETAAPSDPPADPLAGYEAEYKDPVWDESTKTWTCDITNKYNPDFKVYVLKTWDDNEDEENIRPEKITVELMKNGQPVATPTDLTADTSWMATFEGENITKEDGGQRNEYSVREVAVPGYTTEIKTRKGDLADAVSVVNTDDDTKMDIQVTKAWAGDGGDGKARPDTVTVHLTRKGESTPTASLTLTKADGWTGTFIGIPKYQTANNEPVPVEYAVTEDSPDGLYRLASIEPEVVSAENCTGGVIVTNEFTGQTVKVTVRKEWENADLVTLPDSIDFTLFQQAGSEEKTAIRQDSLTKQDSWETVITVPKQDPAGNDYLYSVREDTTGNWTTAYREEEGEGTVTLTITNSIKLVDIPVKKTWDDQDDFYGNRPESIRLYLYSNPGFGAQRMGTVTLSADNNWEGIFQDVPLYPDAKPDSAAEPFNFDVREPYIPGYVTTAEKVQSQTDPVPAFEVKNTLKYRNITIEKIWDDNDDALGFRPDNVTVEVKERGNVIRLVPLRKDTDPAWTSGVSLPDAVNGRTATYEVVEKSGMGPYYERYYPSVSGTDETGFVVTNTLKPQTTDIRVTKEWVDVMEQYPEITLRLMSDREKEGEFRETAACTLNEDTGWIFVFSDMPLYADGGRVIRYDITEDELPGYGLPAIFDMDYKFTVMNWKIPEKARVVVRKIWSDGDDADGIRPDRVTAELLRNGEPTGTTTEITEGTGWYGSFEDLELRDEAGKQIKYSIREEPVAGYDTEITQLLGISGGGSGTSFWEIVNSRNEKATYTITYDPNGGVLHGSTEPESSVHEAGEVILISEAPTREGYRFLYWQGSEYQPGDSYTVTDDHTFIARWEEIPVPTDPPGPTVPPEPTDPPGPPYDFRFVFTKMWSGGTGDSIDWTLYNSDGSVRHKKFNKKVISNTEWQYEAWFVTADDYYIIENVPQGYRVQYVNTGAHAGDTDRCYNGGTIINYKIPKTGDTAPLLLWGAGVLAGMAGLLGLVFRKRLHRRKK